MNKDFMIQWLLDGYESDRFNIDMPDDVDPARMSRAIQTELSRLSELTYREIEALYYSSTDDFACD